MGAGSDASRAEHGERTTGEKKEKSERKEEISG